ncbi:integrase arm-type DNA-binding domain-containing protein [Diaphorobacter sp. HDW4B]|uniref:tyrosine-type recombinase/integrase n=1 Tax=Diaphorobacter sp. HDW4B TaxID=2714925 RepID=UPI00140D4F43|nr:site-specific integrase [Diaphorobacter sp. HDW4B]QIL72917.1 integrase arm-type DNA-binding domain-containing protein [Diaphorobacter sp. HDW4B]
MPKIAKQLSDRAVAALKTEGRYAVGGIAGLHLRISAGHRGWVLRVQVGDKRKDIGLGAYPAVTLAEARERAWKLHESIRGGHDPVAPRKQQRSVLQAQAASEKTFSWCAEEFLKAKSSEWKNAKHRQQWENTLETYATPHLGQLAVSLIDLPHVLACLEPIWSSKNETASRLRGRIESILDWATVRKYRSGENPARWKGHLDKILAAPSKIQKVEHHRAIQIEEMPAFMQNLRSRAGIAARALEFLILTAARSGEVRGATWSEIDLKKAVWTIPAHRMKAGAEHRVPLSGAALRLLSHTPLLPNSDLVFPGTKEQPLSDMSITAVMRRMKMDAVPHGFRSTFRDWAGEKTNYPRELAEQALAHVLSNKVEAAYRRGDALEKRRHLMNDWADFCGNAQGQFAKLLDSFKSTQVD